MTDTLRHPNVDSEIRAFCAALTLAWHEERVPADVSTALDFIHDHLVDEDLSVGSLREACGLRNHNIAFRFKRVVGSSMKEYIETMRLDLAKRLLIMDSLSIVEVGLAVGYGYAESFSRAFKRRVGLSPLRYRRNRLDSSV